MLSAVFISFIPSRYSSGTKTTKKHENDQGRLLIWLGIFGRPVFIYSVIRFWSNGPTSLQAICLFPAMHFYAAMP